MNSGSFRAHVDAKEFLEAFIEAFWKCVPDKPLDQIQCWKSLTAFITGKQSKNGGYWEPIEKCVLPQVADKLGLRHQHEYLHSDLVLFSKGDPWGNLVFVEHENQIGGFGEEIEKLMSVLAPLKVGITYGSAEQGSRLQDTLQKYFADRHPSIHEAPETEYLFLLGAPVDGELWGWKYLSFNILTGPNGTQFRDVGQELHIEGWRGCPR
jgi:hypothetical protein